MRSKLAFAFLVALTAAGCTDKAGITAPDTPSLDGGTLGPGGRAPTDSTGAGIATTQDGGGTLGAGGRE